MGLDFHAINEMHMIQSVIQGCKAGALSGLIWGLLILGFISPMIEKAEVYEEHAEVLSSQNQFDQESLALLSELADTHHNSEQLHRHHSDQDSDFQPKSWQRPLLTLLGSTLLGIAYGILVSIAVALKFLIEPSLLKKSQVKESLELALKWGIGLGLMGFLIFQGIPSIGIQPALPGVIGADKDYGMRQSWWLLSVLCNLAGAFIAFFSQGFLKKKNGLTKTVFRVVPLGVISLPFLTPGVPDYSKSFAVPNVFQRQFVTISLTVSLLFWLILCTTFMYLIKKRTLIRV